MSRVVKYEACPKCRSNGRDNRGDNLVRYADGGGHCFSCGYHEFGSAVHVFRQHPVNYGPKGLLPSDFTREIPTSALKWLLQYGLPYSYWQDSIGYSPSEERLVFLVGSPTQFSIGRYTGTVPIEGKTKRKWYVWGDSHKHTEVVGAGERICLVEDLVSAHKIVVATKDTATPVAAVPLFGVELHPCHKYFLVSEQKPITLWLDKDQQGTIMKKATYIQALTGCPVNTVITEKDPKCLSFETLQTELNAG